MPSALDSLLVFIISVTGFSERQASIRKQCEKLGLTPIFIFDYDPDETSTQTEFKISSSLPPASQSAVLKHLRAQELLIDSKAEQRYALVLEDDALLFDDFHQGLTNAIHFLEHSAHPLTIFLGGADNKVKWPNRIEGKHAIAKGRLTTAEAYLIEKKASKKRLDWVNENGIQFPADHLLTHIDNILSIDQYRCLPPVATQGSITGKFKTTLDDNRKNKNAIFLSLRFRIRRLFRITIPSNIRKLRARIK